MKKEELINLAKEARRQILRMNHRSKASHTGSAFSAVDALIFLYFQYLNVDPKNPLADGRDIFILSKGHASSGLYATLALRGFFHMEVLDKFYVDNGILPGHLDKDAAPGIEISSGSLGHGLPVGLGMAIGNKIKKNNAKTIIMISDGELNEGSIWEALLIAPHLQLPNLTVMVDYNKIQSFGITNEVINLEPLPEKLRAFNWELHEVDGHDFDQLEKALTAPSSNCKIILMHTVKGKGVSFMENKLEWHYRSPDDELLALALEELK